MQASIYKGSVIHRRLKPKRHSLRYRVFWLLLDLDRVDELAGSLRFFSRGHFNLFAFHDRDHGDGSATPLAAQIRARLADAGLSDAGSHITLLAMPRVLGYVFNPLSVYFCSDESGQLRAILYEVHNTFGERHTYVFPMDGAVSAAAEHATPKAFHVSPFLAMDMAYRFRTHPPDDAVAVAISGEDATGPVIFASLSGRREPLSDRALLGLLAGFPLVTLRVIAAIHWHAFRMILKGFRIHRHPRKSAKVAVP